MSVVGRGKTRLVETEERPRSGDGDRTSRLPRDWRGRGFGVGSVRVLRGFFKCRETITVYLSLTDWTVTVNLL